MPRCVSVVCLTRRPSPHVTRAGAQFAEISMFLSITGILATFNIRKHVDENGLEVAPKFEFTTGITRYELGLHPLFDVCRLIVGLVIPSHLCAG